jgi:hypothetical protein
MLLVVAAGLATSTIGAADAEDAAKPPVRHKARAIAFRLTINLPYLLMFP